MTTDLYMQSLLALGGVLVLMLGLLWVVKRIIPGGTAIGGKQRRLKIVESLPVDHRHRLLLIRCDAREHLIMVGHQADLLIEKDIPAVKNALPSVAKEGKIAKKKTQKKKTA